MEEKPLKIAISWSLSIVRRSLIFGLWAHILTKTDERSMNPFQNGSRLDPRILDKDHQN